MTDDLHTRIAAVQRQHFPSINGLECDCLFPLPGGDLDDEPFRLHLADAVIRQLGLREETVAFANGPLAGFKAGPYAGCTGNGVNRRYVTEWEPDD